MTMPTLPRKSPATSMASPSQCASSSCHWQKIRAAARCEIAGVESAHVAVRAPAPAAVFKNALRSMTIVFLFAPFQFNANWLPLKKCTPHTTRRRTTRRT
jgi:hypothetical protein